MDASELKNRYAVGERNFQEVELIGCNLVWMDLSNANLSASNLNRVNLSGANLQKSNFSNCDLTFSDLSRADLTEANLCGANLEGANLSATILSQIIYDQHTRFPKGFDSLLPRLPKEETITLTNQEHVQDIDLTTYSTPNDLSQNLARVSRAVNVHSDTPLKKSSITSNQKFSSTKSKPPISGSSISSSHIGQQHIHDFLSAVESFERGEYQHAQEIIKSLAKIYPENSELLVLRGHIYVLLKQYDFAEIMYRDAQQLNSDPILDDIISDCFLYLQGSSNKKNLATSINDCIDYFFELYDSIEQPNIPSQQSVTNKSQSSTASNQPIIKPKAVQSKPLHTSIASSSNNSQAAISVPQEIKVWNWGAFLVPGIWCFQNKVWVGLLAWIPYVGFFIAIILGAKGNEMAWKSREWKDIATFKEIQRKWAIAGILVWLLLFWLMSLGR